MLRPQEAHTLKGATCGVLASLIWKGLYSTAAVVIETLPEADMVATACVVRPAKGPLASAVLVKVTAVPAAGQGVAGSEEATRSRAPLVGISQLPFCDVTCSAAQDFAALMTCVSAAFALALFCWFRKAGSATAERTPMMMTTISSSTKVKPF